MSIHKNSADSHAAIEPELARRELLIWRHLRYRGMQTDRQVLHALFPGTDDMNKVRPSITALKKDNWVVEDHDTKDATTGVRVRVLRALTPAQRAERIAGAQTQMHFA